MSSDSSKYILPKYAFTTIVFIRFLFLLGTVWMKRVGVLIDMFYYDCKNMNSSKFHPATAIFVFSSAVKPWQMTPSRLSWQYNCLEEISVILTWWPTFLLSCWAAELLSCWTAELLSCWAAELLTHADFGGETRAREQQQQAQSGQEHEGVQGEAACKVLNDIKELRSFQSSSSLFVCGYYLVQNVF